MSKFEKISKYENISLEMPQRKTKYSAGYDIAAAEDIVIPGYFHNYEQLIEADIDSWENQIPLSLEQISKLTKKTKAKPTLIPTGMKCKLADDEFLMLSIRSSCPLKHWIILANAQGIIDSDYYNNADNEGHIYFQVINLSPFDIMIKKGEIIGQGIISKYYTTEDDESVVVRSGGFGSTGE